MEHQSIAVQKTMQIIQTVVVASGLVLNSFSTVILFLRPIFQSRFTNTIIKCQFIVDGVVCGLTLIVLWPGKTEFDSSSSVDWFVCRFGIGQTPYWTFTNFSCQNLIWTTIDLYMAVIHPTQYKQRQTTLVIIHGVEMLISGALIGLEVFFTITIQNEACILTPKEESRMLEVIVLNYFVMDYVLPVLIFIWCYTRILLSLKNMSTSQNKSANAEFRRTSIKFTIACFINVLAFSVLLITDNLLYLLSLYSGLEIEIGSSLQLISLFLVSINSCINPLIYLAVFKKFRISFMRCLCCSSAMSRVENSTTD